MSFEQCVYYAVLMASLTLDRPALKSKARWMGHWLLLLGAKPVQDSTSPSQHLMQHTSPPLSPRRSSPPPRFCR